MNDRTDGEEEDVSNVQEVHEVHRFNNKSSGDQSRVSNNKTNTVSGKNAEQNKSLKFTTATMAI